VLVGVKRNLPRGWWGHETKIEVGVLKGVNIPNRPVSQLLMSQMKELKSVLSTVGRSGKQSFRMGVANHPINKAECKRWASNPI